MSIMTKGGCLVLFTCLVCCWADQSLRLKYLQCVSYDSLSPRKVLVFPLNQTELKETGPYECAKSCLEIDSRYVFFMVHVPATGSFSNQLVCGCGTERALDSAPELLDSSCNLPCPQGSNGTINAVQLSASGEGSSKKLSESWFPDKPSAPSTSKGRLLSLPSGVSGLKNPNQNRKRPSPDHRTCGNGHGLLSVYEFLKNSSANNSQLKTLILVSILIIYNT